jgi:hypothetical protein
MTWIEVDRYHAASCGFDNTGKCLRRVGPAGIEVPAIPLWQVNDIVPNGPILHLCPPIRPSIGEHDGAGEPIPAIRTIRKMRQIRRKLHLQPIFVRVHSDSLVAPGFVGLAVGAEEQPPRFPQIPPLWLRQGCRLKVMTNPGKASTASDHRHSTVLQPLLGLNEPVFEGL